MLVIEDETVARMNSAIIAEVRGSEAVTDSANRSGPTRTATGLIVPCSILRSNFGDRSKISVGAVFWTAQLVALNAILFPPLPPL